MGSDATAQKIINRKVGRRMTPLKQNKVDVRIEPWLSQVKNKGCKVEMNGACAPPSFEGQGTEGNIHGKTTRGDECHHILGALDTEGMPWMSNSINKTWGRGNKDFSGSGSSSCSGSCSSSTCEEDDWEAVADALAASTITRSSSPNDIVGVNHRYQVNNKAWTRGDVFRPRSLPTFSKLQKNSSRDSGRSLSGRPTIMKWQRVVPQPPLSCPICCEDFDVTDTSFHPCPCGFQLCLFCHKKIIEVDSRCPGCRNQYDLAYPGGDSVPFQMTTCSDGKKKRY